MRKSQREGQQRSANPKDTHRKVLGAQHNMVEKTQNLDSGCKAFIHLFIQSFNTESTERIAVNMVYNLDS